MDTFPEQVTELGDITTVAFVAVALGLLLVRLRQPPIVGYILAGILLGPTGMGVVLHTHAITLLAELGVLLLLFLIGMEISIRAFVLVLRPAILIAAGQLSAALGITFFFGWLLEWSTEQALLLGFVVAISSTAVAIKMLEDIDELRTETGRVTVGVMIAQDIAIVPMLILAEALGKEEDAGASVAVLITVAVAILGFLIWYLNKPGKIKLPFADQLTGKPDMIALSALAFCFTFATASSVLGMSPVYGAFVAGLVIANSTLRSEAISVTHPVQSILLFVFFLSIGLLIDVQYIFENWVVVVSFVGIVLVAKTVLNIALIRITGSDWDVALPAGLAMAQIGEFSFILAAVGLKNGVLDVDAYRLALSIIAVSLMISPIWMVTVRRFHAVTERGLTTFRAALAETYAGELAELEKGRNTAAHVAHRGRVYMRAGRRALSRRRSSSSAGKSTREDALPDSNADTPEKDDLS